MSTHATAAHATASSARKRLWQGGLGLALFIATIAVGNGFVSPDRSITRRNAGHDFLAFYTAGTFVRTGRIDQLYDLPAVKSFERELVAKEGLELGPDDFGPFWNPPFYAWLFAPLSALAYHSAWVTWCAMNLLACAVATIILSRTVARAPRACGLDADWRTWGMVPLLMVTSLPFIQSLGHGQNTCISLMILTITLALWRSNRAIAAGLVAGLLFYKPQLGALVAAALILTLGWRALAGLAITGVSLLLITLLTLPGTLAAFLHRLPGNIAFMQIEHHYLWERHVTLKAFWRLLLQGYAVGDLTPLTRITWIVSTAALAACLFATLWRMRRDRSPRTRDRLIAATVAAMPLLMPFYFDYDLLLLSVPATLYACDRLARDHVTPADRRMIWAWVALFAWLFVNPAVAGRTHVNLSVLLLAALSSMLIARARRGEEQEMTAPADSRILRHAA